jgi:ketosteroid isomerase-like protein
MKILSACLLLVLAISPAAGQRRKSDLQSLVETERSFSRASAEKGIRESFSEFIADDGILFRPTAVPGKKWMQEHPLPPSSTRPLLTWQPIVAGISEAGDMGYTTGPWQRKNDIKDAKPAAFGNFMTVWKKQADGKWRFVIDLGITNPEPKNPIGTWHGPLGSRSARFRVDQLAAREDLLTTERNFSKASAEQGAVSAFLLYGAADVRVFRNNKMPFVGRRSAVAALSPLSIEWTWTPKFADVALSGDLGYSYGIYELREKAGKRSLVETGNYLRVWKKVRGTWAVVIDVADPLPLENKSS